ncbi:MAG: DUF2651 family protein [Lysinibacillus sp.]
MEFLFVLVICPLIVVIASVIGTFLFKKWFIAPIAIFAVFTILTFTIFYETFFFWTVVFTVLSTAVGLSVGLMRK